MNPLTELNNATHDLVHSHELRLSEVLTAVCALHDAAAKAQARLAESLDPMDRAISDELYRALVTFGGEP